MEQVGRELGVRDVLEDSVRKAANRMRITAQLIDAATGAHLWAERFDGSLEDIFTLQDRVSASAAGTIAPKMEQAEIQRAKRKPTRNLDSYDYFLRGVANAHEWTREANAEASRREVGGDPRVLGARGSDGAAVPDSEAMHLGGVNRPEWRVRNERSRSTRSAEPRGQLGCW